MIGKLSNDQIANVLYRQTIGRIACYDEGRLYIVPISYAFEPGYIYGHSMEGLKIKMMRNNPRVCFQVDEIENMTSWRSVIIWGEYQELEQDDEYQAGLKILKSKLDPMVTSSAVHPHHSRDTFGREIVEKGKKILVFRIQVLEQSGRFEKNLAPGQAYH